MMRSLDVGQFCTVGHSSRCLAEFIEILQEAGVRALADVRRFPHSRSNPAFNIDTLPEALAAYQIGYRHFSDLGGRRGGQHAVPEAVNAFWQNQSFHNYADYALSEPFGHAFAELVAFGQQGRVAIMCAEAVWWRCHRRIITDYLLLSGHEVSHLMGQGRETSAQPTRGVVSRANGQLVYPQVAKA